MLRLSILEDGWTQPIVLRQLDELDVKQHERVEFVIVDGFHRWSVGQEPKLAYVSGGLVPTVLIDADPVQRRLATVRHNRARGHHGVLSMGSIILQLRESGCDDAEIGRRLGMTGEEISRLADTRGAAATFAKDSFGKGWVPTERK